MTTTAEGYAVLDRRGQGRIVIDDAGTHFDVQPCGPGFAPGHPGIVAILFYDGRRPLYVDEAGGYVLGDFGLWMDLRLHGVDIADWLRSCRAAGITFPCPPAGTGET